MMRHIGKYLMILLLSCVLAMACKKLFYKTEVKGHVIDNATGAGIAGVKVYLLKGNSDLASSGSDYSNTDTYTYTGSDGSYSFSFNRSEYDNYGLYAQADKNKYFQYGSSADFIDISFSKKFRKDIEEKDIYLKPLSTIKFNIIKTDTSYESLYLDIQLLNGSTVAFQDNYTFNDTVLVEALGGEYQLKVSVIKYLAGNIIYDNLETYNVYCTPFDTTFYQVHY